MAAEGDRVSVLLPLYGQIAQRWREKMNFRCYIYVDLGWRHEYCGLFSLEYRGVTWYFVDNERYFRRRSLYGDMDDGERFAFFSKAAEALLPHLAEYPNVIHCNDWQTALVPVYLRDAGNDLPVVFTIHNIEYQGKYGPETVEDLFGLNRGWYDGGILRMDGCVNLMKAAMLTANAVTTVSPTYARQLHDPAYACGLEQVVQLIDYKLSGVLNGLDMESFDPAHDASLPQTYDPDHMEGKAVCKRELQRQLGLAQEPDTPLPPSSAAWWDTRAWIWCARGWAASWPPAASWWCWVRASPSLRTPSAGPRAAGRAAYPPRSPIPTTFPAGFTARRTCF